jgi:hypothetical protein
LGIELFNTSPYPISFFLERASTEIEGFIPQRSIFPKWPYVISAGGRLRLCDDPINTEQRPCGVLSGTISMDVKYGRASKEKYNIHIEGRVTIQMEQSGLVTAVVLDLTHKIE